jgi:hypothetical protein
MRLETDLHTNGKTHGFTLWSFNIAIENGPFIVDLPIKDGDFP